MAAKNKNLSKQEGSALPSAKKMKFGMVVSEWNSEITESLKQAAVETLLGAGCAQKDIVIKYVPGSFELPMGAQLIAANTDVDAVICLGCVIQGETRHFDFICDAIAHGITQLSLDYHMPVIFGVLTPNDMKQAKARSGGKHGNKGVEAAATAIKMVALQKEMEK